MTGRVFIVGNDLKETKALHQALRQDSRFLSRLVAAQDASIESILQFKPDVVVLSPAQYFESMRPMYFGLQKEPATRDIPIVAVLTENELGSASIPTEISDVFCRPLRIHECLSRLALLYRRSNRMNDKNLIRTGDLCIDVAKYVVQVGTRQVDLTFTEYQLLKFFMTHPDQVFNRDVLLNKVWGYEYYGGGRTVDVHVRRLRSKIEIGRRRFIETMRNIGYKFISQAD